MREAAERPAIRTVPLRQLTSGQRNVRNGGDVRATVSLQQTLVGGREEREPVEKVLVVDFDALGESGVRVSRDDQADQHAVAVHLMTIRGRAAAQAPAVGAARIDGGVK